MWRGETVNKLVHIEQNNSFEMFFSGNPMKSHSTKLQHALNQD